METLDPRRVGLWKLSLQAEKIECSSALTTVLRLKKDSRQSLDRRPDEIYRGLEVYIQASINTNPLHLLIIKIWIAYFVKVKCLILPNLIYIC